MRDAEVPEDCGGGDEQKQAEKCPLPREELVDTEWPPGPVRRPHVLSLPGRGIWEHRSPGAAGGPWTGLNWVRSLQRRPGTRLVESEPFLGFCLVCFLERGCREVLLTSKGTRGFGVSSERALHVERQRLIRTLCPDRLSSPLPSADFLACPSLLKRRCCLFRHVELLLLARGRVPPSRLWQEEQGKFLSTLALRNSRDPGFHFGQDRDERTRPSIGKSCNFDPEGSRAR